MISSFTVFKLLVTLSDIYPKLPNFFAIIIISQLPYIRKVTVFTELN